MGQLNEKEGGELDLSLYIGKVRKHSKNSILYKNGRRVQSKGFDPETGRFFEFSSHYCNLIKRGRPGEIGVQE